MLLTIEVGGCVCDRPPPSCVCACVRPCPPPLPWTVPPPPPRPPLYRHVAPLLTKVSPPPPPPQPRVVVELTLSPPPHRLAPRTCSSDSHATLKPVAAAPPSPGNQNVLITPVSILLQRWMLGVCGIYCFFRVLYTSFISLICYILLYYSLVLYLSRFHLFFFLHVLIFVFLFHLLIFGPLLGIYTFFLVIYIHSFITFIDSYSFDTVVYIPSPLSNSFIHLFL